MATNKQIGPVMHHDGPISGALFNQDGAFILSWSEDKTLRLWDVDIGTQIGPSMPHDAPVYRAQLSRDETRILSSSEDKTVRLWDVSTGNQIGPSLQHDGTVVFAEWTTDENGVLSWSGNTARLWDVSIGKQIGRRCSTMAPSSALYLIKTKPEFSVVRGQDCKTVGRGSKKRIGPPAAARRACRRRAVDRRCNPYCFVGQGRNGSLVGRSGRGRLPFNVA